MPSAICYEQIAGGHWSEHFCLVNPTCRVENEEEASAMAAADFREAFATMTRPGGDIEIAEYLKRKGYVRVDGFRRAGD